MNDRDALTAISTKLDTLIGAETNGLRDEVPPGSSVQRTEQDGEHGRWGHDYRLANKYLEALDIGQPGLIDRDELERLAQEYIGTARSTLKRFHPYRLVASSGPAEG